MDIKAHLDEQEKFNFAIEQIWQLMSTYEKNCGDLQKLNLPERELFFSDGENVIDNRWGRRQPTSEYETEIFKEKIRFSSSWIDYCRGCEMGTLYDYMELPITVLNACINRVNTAIDDSYIDIEFMINPEPLKQYVQERWNKYVKISDQRKQVATERAEKAKFTAQALQEEKDRQEFIRLQAKFGVSNV